MSATQCRGVSYESSPAEINVGLDSANDGREQKWLRYMKNVCNSTTASASGGAPTRLPCNAFSCLRLLRGREHNNSRRHLWHSGVSRIIASNLYSILFDTIMVDSHGATTTTMLIVWNEKFNDVAVYLWLPKNVRAIQ